MTTPRFLILPGVCVNVDDIVAIVESDNNLVGVPNPVHIHVRTTGTLALYVANMRLADVVAALREAMKGPETAPSGSKAILYDPISGDMVRGYVGGMSEFVPATDIAAQARETREAGGGE